MFLEAMYLALTNLKTNRLRFILTLLGISVGVVLAVTTSLLSYGFRDKMMKEMRVAGDTVINVAVGNKSNTLNYSPRPIFNNSHLTAIRSQQHVVSAYGIIYYTAQGGMIEVKKKGVSQNRRLFQNIIFGTEPGYFKSIGVKFDIGNTFSSSSEVVIGSDIAKAGKVNVGDSLIIGINGQKRIFRISGIIEKQPLVAFSDFGQMVNNLIVVPEESLPNLNYSLISVRVDSPKNTNKIASNSAAILNRDENIKAILSSTAYSIVGVSQKDVIDMVDRWFNYIRLFTLGLSVLASAIAMVGVINVTLITILERFREIGIMKAIGASNSQILSLYMVEVGLVGLAGATIGLAFGICASYIIANIISLPFIFQGSIVLLAILLGFIATLIAGLIPAMRAYKLDPNVALMYE